MKYKKRWSDEEVLSWADTFISRKTTLMKLESMIGVSHSTLWWNFIHRLPRLDINKYALITNCFVINTRFRNRKEKSDVF